MVESQFERTDPTPTLHQQRSQAHSADSPKYQGGEKMPDEARFVPTKFFPLFSVVLPSSISMFILEQKFIPVNKNWFEFSNLKTSPFKKMKYNQKRRYQCGNALNFIAQYVVSVYWYLPTCRHGVGSSDESVFPQMGIPPVSDFRGSACT